MSEFVRRKEAMRRLGLKSRRAFEALVDEGIVRARFIRPGAKALYAVKEVQDVATKMDQAEMLCCDG